MAFLLLGCAALVANAARLSVRSFAPDPFDLTAKTNQRLDKNRRPCALVVVELPVPGSRFQGNIVGDVEYMGSQYNVYLTEGTKMLKILCPNCEPFIADLVDADGNVGVTSSVTYHLTLDGYETVSGTPQNAGPNGSYLTLNITPRNNVVVKIDGEMQPVDNGEVVKFLLTGSHQILVEAPGYAPYSENINIDNSGTKNLDVKLQSNMAKLTVTTLTDSATIKIDGKLQGTGTVELTLAPGQYLLEAEKEGYRSHSQMITLGPSEQISINLPILTPVYGVLDIDYRPVGATVTIDGNAAGSTPCVLRDIIVGTHNITVSKEGYEPYITTLAVTEDNTATLTGKLSEKKAKKNIEVTVIIEKGHKCGFR